MLNKLKKFILPSIVLASLLVAGRIDVLADVDCEPVYGGGEECDFDRSFRITKEVRRLGEEDWDSDGKVHNIKKDQIVEFRVTIKNKGDITTDDMKMKDILPDEMERVGGSGLTEYFEDFEPGDEKEFIIEAKVRDEEFDREGDFEDCVTNKAEVYFDKNFEGSAKASVCFGKGEISELPKTGAETGIISTVAGFGLVALGTLLKKKLA